MHIYVKTLDLVYKRCVMLACHLLQIRSDHYCRFCFNLSPGGHKVRCGPNPYYCHHINYVMSLLLSVKKGQTCFHHEQIFKQIYIQPNYCIERTAGVPHPLCGVESSHLVWALQFKILADNLLYFDKISHIMAEI